MMNGDDLMSLAKMAIQFLKNGKTTITMTNFFFLNNDDDDDKRQIIFANRFASGCP